MNQKYQLAKKIWCLMENKYPNTPSIEIRELVFRRLQNTFVPYKFNTSEIIIYTNQLLNEHAIQD